MDTLKKIWPTPFKIQANNVVSFVKQLVIFLVVCAIVGALIGILVKIPIIGIIFGIIGSLLEIYSFVGIILCILKFLDIAK